MHSLTWPLVEALLICAFLNDGPAARVLDPRGHRPKSFVLVPRQHLSLDLVNILDPHALGMKLRWCSNGLSVLSQRYALPPGGATQRPVILHRAPHVVLDRDDTLVRKGSPCRCSICNHANDQEMPKTGVCMYTKDGFMSLFAGLGPLDLPRYRSTYRSARKHKVPAILRHSATVPCI